MEKSYVMIKPGYLEHKDEIIKRIEEIGGKIVAEKTLNLDKEILREHYAHIVQFDFYPELEQYMTSGECYGMIVEGEAGIIAKIREIVGPTKNAPKGTIRGDFMKPGVSTSQNVIHASDAVETAEAEIERFFG